MQCKISGGDETTGDEDGQRHQGICFCWLDVEINEDERDAKDDCVVIFLD